MVPGESEEKEIIDGQASADRACIFMDMKMDALFCVLSGTKKPSAMPMVLMLIGLIRFFAQGADGFFELFAEEQRRECDSKEIGNRLSRINSHRFIAHQSRHEIN